MARKQKHMRLPNGFGSITELKKKNLRNPYMARKTIKKDCFGKPILKVIGYYPTYNKAYEALVEYNKNPYDLDTELTLSEVYEKWSDSYFKKLTSISSIRTITSAWAYCTPIYNMKINEVRSRHLKGCIDDAYIISQKGKNKGDKVFASTATKARIKSLFNLLFDYACEYELADKNYARLFNLDEDIVKANVRNKNDHIPFTDNEITTLWENVNDVKHVDIILIGIYTGWRPQELATLKLENIDLEQKIMTGGTKTEAGKNRIVPIHPKIFDLVLKNYSYAISINSGNLFNDIDGQQGTTLTYDKYRNRFKKVIERLPMELEHRPHDTRHTFITLAKKYHVDEYAIKRIVGHKIIDITENVYTHRDIEWLQDEIKKIE